MQNKIKSINIAVTNRCNLNCAMCDIWEEKPKTDISLNLIKKILQSKYLSKDADITLTGGEPFLHKNLFDLTRIILAQNANALKTISTNGVLTEEILNYLDEFKDSLPKDFSLHISLDGVNKHDLQRGKSLNKVLKTIEQVKERFPSLDIKIKFTTTPLNYKDLIPTYNFCKDNSLDFRVKLVECAENYTNKIEKKEFGFDDAAKKKIAKDILKIYEEKIKSDKENAIFLKNTIKFLLGRMRPAPCKAPSKRIFIMPNGDVYSCIHFDKIGNLNKEKLDNILNSEAANLIRNKIKKDRCGKCIAYHGLTY